MAVKAVQANAGPDSDKFGETSCCSRWNAYESLFFFPSSLAGLPSLIRHMVCMDVKHISFFAVLRA